MSCHSTPINSSFAAYVQSQYPNMSEKFVNSLFHELKRRHRLGIVTNTYTPEQYTKTLDNQIQRINRRVNEIGQERANSMVTRIEEGRNLPFPDQATLYALNNLNPKARERDAALSSLFLDIAIKTRQPVANIKKYFEETVTSVARGVDFSLDNQGRLLAEQYGLGENKSLVHGLQFISELSKSITDKILETVPKRIQRGEVSLEKGKTNLSNLVVIEAGTDPRNKRFEVLVFDAETGESTEYAYRNVSFPEDSVNLDGTFSDTFDIGAYWYNNVRGSLRNAYPSEEASALAGRAPNCLACGQFSDYSHACPSKVEPVIITRADSGIAWGVQKVILPPYLEIYEDGVYTSNAPSLATFDLPLASVLRQLIDNQPITITGLESRITRNRQFHSGTEDAGYVSGAVTVYKNDDNELKFNINKLLCSCGKAEPLCLHMNILLDGLKNRITSSNEDFNELSIEIVQKAREQIGEEVKSIISKAEQMNWSLNPITYSEAQKTWIQESEAIYSQNTDAFIEDYAQVINSATLGANGKPVIPYLRENALGGLAQRGSGQGFGIEIEYDLGSVNHYEANRKIGAELHALGILPDPSQGVYHSFSDNRDDEYDEYSRDPSYDHRRESDTQKDSSGRGNWTFENDGSVSGGEIISPIMYDEAETWTNLEKVIEVITRNGGVVSRSVGGHVHVGTAFYNGDPKKYAELARLMAQHEDVLYRIASDPVRGTHRGGHYARPIPIIAPNGFQSISDLRIDIGRNGLNYSYVDGDRRDHPEFRLFDGTLNPGAVQAHVKLAVAMTHAAARAAELGGTSRGKEPIGNHLYLKRIKEKSPEYSSKTDNEKLLDETTTFRSLLDTLFSRREDKKHILSLFASTQWAEDPNK